MATEESTEPEKIKPAARRRTSKPVSQEDGSVKMEEMPPPDGPQVYYIGPATRRILTPEDWKNVGVEDTDHKTYVWDIDNSKMIPKAEFSPQQLDYLTRDDRFEIEEG